MRLQAIFHVCKGSNTAVLVLVQLILAAHLEGCLDGGKLDEA